MRQESRASSPPRRCVVVTPALAYGSWSWFEDVIRHSPDVSWLVVGYGTAPPDAPANARFFTIRGGDYLKVGRVAARTWLLWLNFLYVLPLVLVAALHSWRRKPAVVVGNGIAATALLPLCRLGSRQTRVWLAYHSAIGHLPEAVHGVIRAVLAPVAGAVCNSLGNEQELRLVMQGRPVVPVEHWADDTFFTGDVGPSADARHHEPSHPLRILYVGRTDPEKFGQCLRVCTMLAEEKLVELTVVGPVATAPSPPGVHFVGYVSSRAELHELYRRADVTWAPADVDYLSRPGVEALASGCPIIVSDIPAVEGKCDGAVRIPRSLVPDGVGVVVDGKDDAEVIGLLRSWAAGASSPGHRRACRDHAGDRYSSQNIRRITDAWFAPDGAPEGDGPQPGSTASP